MRPQDSVGMRRGVEITLAPYNPLWPDEFARVRAELTGVLPDWILSIDHVGSTSVPGLHAKPIIDVSVAVPDLHSWHRRNSLTFRDALRRSPELARRYGELKRRVAVSAGRNRLEYLNGKTDFILGVLRAEGCEPDPDYPVHYI